MEWKAPFSIARASIFYNNPRIVEVLLKHGANPRFQCQPMRKKRLYNWRKCFQKQILKSSKC